MEVGKNEFSDTTSSPRRWDISNHKKIKLYYKCCNSIIIQFESDSSRLCRKHHNLPTNVQILNNS